MTLCQEAKEILLTDYLTKKSFDHSRLQLATAKAFRRARGDSFSTDLTVMQKESVKRSALTGADPTWRTPRWTGPERKAEGLPQVPPPGSKARVGQSFNPESFPDEIARQRSEALHAAASFRPASFRQQGARPKVPIVEASSGRPDFRSNPDHYGVPGQYRPDAVESRRVVSTRI